MKGLIFLLVIMLASVQVMAKPFAVYLNPELFKERYNANISDLANIQNKKMFNRAMIKSVVPDPLDAGVFDLIITSNITGYAGTDEKGFIDIMMWSMDIKDLDQTGTAIVTSSSFTMVGVLDETFDKDMPHKLWQCMKEAIKTRECELTTTSNTYRYDYLPETERLVLEVKPR